ncbi:MAG: hypothetical protein VCD00_01080 [Candidatus Hydrogenedentota bacterium]
MNAHEVNEIIQCMPEGRTVFHYFKDRYALGLLANYVSEPTPLRMVKQSRYGGLLNKYAVQRAVANCVDGTLSSDQLHSVWPLNPKAFVLSLGRWGERSRYAYTQTSRTGFNLVLHLNFSNEHNARYRELLNVKGRSPFTYMGHPNDSRGRNTMAWARMDIDLARGEVLIEEIQNDWLRNSRQHLEWLNQCTNRGEKWSTIKRRYPFNWPMYEGVRSTRALLTYLEHCVSPYERIWDEAMLYATIWFLQSELGIHRIFYNTLETGCRMKGIDLDFAPPRSIYSSLPKRFCFEQTEEYPENIDYRVARAKKKFRKPMRWYLLEL